MNAQQQELFYCHPERAFARSSDPGTSKAAAESVTERLPDLEALCLNELRRAPDGLTTEELAGRLKLSLVTVSPRMRPLFKKGLITAGLKRENRSGHKAIAWKAVIS